MKSLQFKLSYLFFYLCLCHSAHSLQISDIYVSITADSSATAQEQAIREAHLKAYTKLLEYSDNTNLPRTPSVETVMDMVTGFSVEREKTTATSYSALFTFDFDDAQLTPQPPSLSSLKENNAEELKQNHPSSTTQITLFISYKNQEEWIQLQAMLHSISAVKSFILLSLNSHEAEIHLQYNGTIEQLSTSFGDNNYLLLKQENGTIRLNKAAPSLSLEGIVNEYSELD